MHELHRAQLHWDTADYGHRTSVLRRCHIGRKREYRIAIFLSYCGIKCAFSHYVRCNVCVFVSRFVSSFGVGRFLDLLDSRLLLWGRAFVSRLIRFFTHLPLDLNRERLITPLITSKKSRFLHITSDEKYELCTLKIPIWAFWPTTHYYCARHTNGRRECMRPTCEHEHTLHITR